MRFLERDPWMGIPTGFTKQGTAIIVSFLLLTVGGIAFCAGVGFENFSLIVTSYLQSAVCK